MRTPFPTLAALLALVAAVAGCLDAGEEEAVGDEAAAFSVVQIDGHLYQCDTFLEAGDAEKPCDEYQRGEELDEDDYAQAPTVESEDGVVTLDGLVYVCDDPFATEDEADSAGSEPDDFADAEIPCEEYVLEGSGE